MDVTSRKRDTHRLSGAALPPTCPKVGFQGFVGAVISGRLGYSPHFTDKETECVLWSAPPAMQLKEQVTERYRQAETVQESSMRNLLCVFCACETKKKRLERKTSELITGGFLGRGLGWVRGAISLTCNAFIFGGIHMLLVKDSISN